VVEVEGGTLTALAGFDGHQGVALVVAPRRWATLDEIVARARERSEPSFVLVLDSLEDPQNVGTLLRTAEACGVHGVLFPTRRSAPLTPSAVKASAGAVEHLLLCPVDDLGGALADLRGLGLRLIGADEGAALAYRDADLRGALGLVVGSEAHGLSGAVRRRLDGTVRLPMRGKVASLNASVAGSVLLFEAASQRDPEAPSVVTDPAPVTPAPSPLEVDEPEAAADAEPVRRRSRSVTPSATTKDGSSKRAPRKPRGPAVPDVPVPEAPPPGEAATTASEPGTDQPRSAAGSDGDELLPGDR